MKIYNNSWLFMLGSPETSVKELGIKVENDGPDVKICFKYINATDDDQPKQFDLQIRKEDFAQHYRGVQVEADKVPVTKQIKRKRAKMMTEEQFEGA